jgi:hypothetical protein
MSQLAVERQQAESDRISYQLELSRMQDRIGSSRNTGPPTTRTYVLNGRDNGNNSLIPAAGSAVGSGSAHGSGSGSRAGTSSGGSGARSGLTPRGYIGYWFGSGNSGGANSSGSSGGETIIIKV